MIDDDAERLARRAAAALRAEPIEPPPDALLAAVRADTRTDAAPGAPPFARRLPWWMSLTLAGATTFVLGVVVGHNYQRRGRGRDSTTLAVQSGAPVRPVAFVFADRRAEHVALVGEFNGWNPHAAPMNRSGDGGSWTISLMLPAGRHLYAFVVDDSTWVPDPQAPIAPEAWYGTRSSVLVVADRVSKGGGDR